MSSRQALGAMIPSLSDKLKSADSDIRVMALIDLNKELTRILATQPTGNKGAQYADETSEKVVTSLVLGLLKDDSNAEVKNAVVACLANMSKRARPAYLRQIIETITKDIGAPGEPVNEEKRDVACLALKSVVTEMNPESAEAETSLTTIIERIRQNVCVADANPHLSSELLLILTEIYPRFASTVVASPELQTLSVTTFREVLSIPRLSIRKRAVSALAAFNTVCPSHFEGLKGDMANAFAQGGDSAKAWVAAIAGIAKTSSHSDVGSLIASGGLVESILKQTDSVEDTEAVEGALTALEVLALRCPSELSPYVKPTMTRALDLIKYDPNYVELDDDEDEDVDMDDDDDDFDDDAYSDDDDDSWKIRRSAAKLLHALISTRVDLLADFYKTAATPLMVRFNEREESVRLEILAAFEALLEQTGNAREAELSAGGRNKRKRADEMDADSDDTAVAALLDLSPRLVKAILKQATVKSVVTRQQAFSLLRQIVTALHGGLEAEADPICTAAMNALRSSDSTSPSLTIAVLSFLTAFFQHHSARSYISWLPELTKDIVRCMGDKLQRVNFEAFAAASALACAIRPNIGSGSPLRSGYDGPIQEIFSVTCNVLGDSSIDSDVRERALRTLGEILVHEGDVIINQHSDALGLITARLASETTASTAIEVIGRVADAQLCSGPAFQAWLLEVLSAVVVSIRRNKHSMSKTAEFNTINSIIRRLGSSLPQDIASGIVIELKPFVESPAALETLTIILEVQPGSRDTVTEHILPEILKVIKTVNNPIVIKSLTALFGSYVTGDVDSAIRLVPSLVMNLPKAEAIPDATLGGTAPYTTTARCIGAVVQHSQRNLAGILATFQRTISSGKRTVADIYLALLCIGEIGRFDDLSVNHELFQSVLGYLAHNSEEVRSAAAFAAGNMAVGAPNDFLPALIQRFETAPDESSRLLLLHSLKEVILHSSDSELDKLADILWRPLFSDLGSEAASDDGMRNVKAACIGKLTVASPARFLPQLQEMVHGTSQQRALVAAAIRYTFIDSNKGDATSRADELIAPVVGDLLSLMKDDSVVVRRLAVAALNAASQSRYYLIADKLSVLQTYLYEETEVKKELQREVTMGPWKVLEDEGLENRKTAYETMYTLLATCFAKLDLAAFTERVLAALTDVNEIKILGLMLLLRLAQLSPIHVIPRLDEVAQSLTTIMKDLEVKEDTIKQDLERKEEMQRSTLRTAVPLYRMSTAAQAPVFHAFVLGLLKMDQWKEYHDYQA